MDYIEANVVFKSSKTNFISLPQSTASMLYNANINSQEVICEMSWSASSKREKKYAFCGWSGFATSQAIRNGNSIEIDPLFASVLQLSENTQISINLKVNGYTIAKTVELEPLSRADWEMVELNAGVLENNLLYQARCVSPGQTIVVFPSGSTNAKLKVLKFEPNGDQANTFARIVNDTEFHIKPVAMTKTNNSNGKSSRKTTSTKSRSSKEKLPKLLLRGMVLPNGQFPSCSDTKKCEVYLQSREYADKFPNAEYVFVSVLKGPKKNESEKNQQQQALQQEDPESSGANSTTLAETEKVVARIVNYPGAPDAHVGISPLVASALGLSSGSVGSLIILEPAMRPTTRVPHAVTIHPYIKESESIKTQVSLKMDGAVDRKISEKEERSQKAEQLRHKFQTEGLLKSSCITNCMRLPALSGDILPYGGMLEFGKLQESWLESVSFEQTDVKIGEPCVRAESFLCSTDATTGSEFNSKGKIVGQDKFIDGIVSKLSRCNVGALLYGSAGSGKSSIVEVVETRLSDKGIHICKLNCESLAMESSSAVMKKIEDHARIASWHSPSILVLEDADALMPSEQEHTDNTMSRQVAEYLVQIMLNRTMKRRRVGVILTAKNKTSINSVLFNTHLIEEEFALKPPGKELRALILNELFAQSQLEIEEPEIINEIATVETEGYVAADLRVLVDRVRYTVISRRIEYDQKISSSPFVVSMEDFKASLEGFTPSSLRGVKLQKSTVDWNTIGGLTQAKSILLETLEWPTKYAPIFDKCPLRLRSGILLYGYPGCGKTLLASAVASQCGLNFISVKGPEILNKYIGASEQSVRDLFDRAQAAKPCILFFDEFDSIAPKRGHDSTGVTDRVVNQMLTQMDGAEGLDGVYVLAATSRPDLIDSALLRPGRLDKSLICDIPNHEDRLDILRCITEKMNLSADVDIIEIANKTEGYSGADLQAVGYNAYLIGVHEKLEQDKISMTESKGSSDLGSQETIDFFQLNEKKDLLPHERIAMTKKLETMFKTIALNNNDATTNGTSSPDGDAKSSTTKSEMVLVTQKHFLEALKDTKPSISQKEKFKLSNIYQQFLNPNDRQGDMQDGTASGEIGGRSTLA